MVATGSAEPVAESISREAYQAIKRVPSVVVCPPDAPLDDGITAAELLTGASAAGAREVSWSRPRILGASLLLTGLAFASARAPVRPAIRERSRLGSAVSIAADAHEDYKRCGVMESDVEYKGHVLTQLAGVDNAGECCSSCQDNSTCRLWTWSTHNKTCDLMTLAPNGQVQKATQKGLVSGLPFQWDKLDSMFCWSLMMPHGYERDLLEMQYKKRWNLFACDEYAVYSNKAIELGRGLRTSVVDSDLNCTSGGEFGTSLNTEIFIKVWKKVIADGRYKYNDWTIKVDPDCVFFAERLRVALAFHPDTYNGLYLNNCKFGMHGPIEVFSTKAIDAWGAGMEHCMTHFNELCSGSCLWGEDMFIDQCLLKVLKVHRDDDWNLLSEPHCASDDWKECSNHRVAFHPFKNASVYAECVKKAEFGALPMMM